MGEKGRENLLVSETNRNDEASRVESVVTVIVNDYRQMGPVLNKDKRMEHVGVVERSEDAVSLDNFVVH